MKTKIILIRYTMLAFAFFGFVPVKAQHDNRSSFNNLRLLEGTWIMKTGKGMLFESWQITDDSTLTGNSFLVRSSDTTMLEQVKLTLRDNKMYYTPVMPGQNNG